MRCAPPDLAGQSSVGDRHRDEQGGTRERHDLAVAGEEPRGHVAPRNGCDGDERDRESE
jgi:hypothetical protein